MRTIDFHAMNTEVRVGVLHDSPTATRALESAVAVFPQHERVLSRTKPSSELSQLNRSQPWPVRVSPLLLRAVRTALDASTATGGLVDPRVFGEPAATQGNGSTDRSATATHIAALPAARESCRVVADPVRMTVELPRGVELNLDDVARALAIDAAAAQLKSCRGFLVEAGGDVRVGGLPSASQPWQIGIADPRNPARCIVTLKVREGAVVTVPAGRHHSRSGGSALIDPRTGAVMNTDLLSVTVVAGTATGADVLARAALIAGAQEGLQLLESRCIAGLLVLRDGRVLATGTMRSYLS
jgi:thiamine biosynthesis lipoprotein